MYAAVGYVMGSNTAHFDFFDASEIKLEGEMVGTNDLGCSKIRKLGKKSV